MQYLKNGKPAFWRGKYNKNQILGGNMKNFLVILAVMALVFSVAISFAEEKKESGLEFTFEPTAGTRYVSDFGITYLRNPFIGQTATLSSEKTGWYGAGLNMYAPSRKFNSGETEAGWFEGYAGKTGKASFFEYDAYVGAWTYEINRISHVGNTVYAGTELKFPKILGMTPFLGSEYYYLPKETSQNGFVWRGGVEFNVWNVKLKAFATGHDKVFESNSALLASGIASASYEIPATWIHKSAKFIPVVSYQHRLEKEEREGGLTQGGFWTGLALKITF
ncbi:MAG: hypothetical protein V1804_04600 [Patescibacteria group bacterium]